MKFIISKIHIRDAMTTPDNNGPEAFQFSGDFIREVLGEYMPADKVNDFVNLVDQLIYDGMLVFMTPKHFERTRPAGRDDLPDQLFDGVYRYEQELIGNRSAIGYYMAKLGQDHQILGLLDGDNQRN